MKKWPLYLESKEHPRHRLVITEQPEGLKIAVQEFCPKGPPREDGLKTLWGTIATFILEHDTKRP